MCTCETIHLTSQSQQTIYRPDGGSPRVLFQLVPEPKTVKNRLHLDVRVGAENIEKEVERLTARQRDVFLAITLNQVPIDVLAERLNTTRGALYKTLHDARHNLRTALAARGLGIAGEERS